MKRYLLLSEIYAWPFRRVGFVIIINRLLIPVAVYGILHYTLIGRIAGEEAVFSIRSMKDFAQQPELYRETVMNVFLYFPFGLILPYAMPQ